MQLFNILIVAGSLPLMILAQTTYSLNFNSSEIATCLSTSCTASTDPATLQSGEACATGNNACECSAAIKLSTPCLTCLLQEAQSNINASTIVQGCASIIANGTTTKPNGAASVMAASFLGAGAGAAGMVAGLLLL